MSVSATVAPSTGVAFSAYMRPRLRRFDLVPCGNLNQMIAAAGLTWDAAAEQAGIPSTTLYYLARRRGQAPKNLIDSLTGAERPSAKARRKARRNVYVRCANFSALMKSAGLTGYEAAKRFGVATPTIASWSHRGSVPAEVMRHVLALSPPHPTLPSGFARPSGGLSFEKLRLRAGLSASGMARRYNVDAGFIRRWERHNAAPADVIADVESLVAARSVPDSAICDWPAYWSDDKVRCKNFGGLIKRAGFTKSRLARWCGVSVNKIYWWCAKDFAPALLIDFLRQRVADFRASADARRVRIH